MHPAPDSSPTPPQPAANVPLPAPETIRHRGNLLFGLGVLLILAAVAGGIATVAMPKKYRGTAVIEVEWPQGQGTGSEDDTVPPTFMATQFALLTSKEILYQVVDKLELAKRWPETRGSRDAACARLLDMVKAGDEHGIYLINISALSTAKSEAAELANAVARSYVERQADWQKKRVKTTIEMLDQQRKEQMEKVEKSRAKMLELMERYQIVDFGDHADTRGRDGKSGSRSLVQESMEQEVETASGIDDFRAILNTLKGRTGDDLINAASQLNITDPGTSNLLPKYLTDLSELKAMIATGRGENHPQILALKERISSTKKTLEAGVTAVIGNLETKLRMAEATLAHMKKVRAESTKDSTPTNPGHIAYKYARDDYELQARLLLKMLERQTNRLPSIHCFPTPTATIFEYAAVPKTHATPNVPLQLALCAAALAAGLGGVRIGRRMRARA